MHDNLALTGGLLTSERVAATLAPLLGARRAKELLTTASRAAAVDGTTLDQALADVVADTLDPVPPELGSLITTDRIRDLTDPAHSTGSAQALVDRALRSFCIESGTAHDPTSN